MYSKLRTIICIVYTFHKQVVNNFEIDNEQKTLN